RRGRERAGRRDRRRQSGTPDRRGCGYRAGGGAERWRMTVRIASLDLKALDHDGFAVLNGLIQPQELACFERDIALAGEALAKQRGIERRSAEPIADVLKAAGRHRAMLFDHIKRLFVLERLSVEIGTALEQAGLFRHSGIAVPIVWPTLRA